MRLGENELESEEAKSSKETLVERTQSTILEKIITRGKTHQIAEDGEAPNEKTQKSGKKQIVTQERRL
jgi:hypothetical protein